MSECESEGVTANESLIRMILYFEALPAACKDMLVSCSNIAVLCNHHFVIASASAAVVVIVVGVTGFGSLEISQIIGTYKFISFYPNLECFSHEMTLEIKIVEIVDSTKTSTT